MSSLRPARSPLPWLGGLLALYLAVPVVAFAARVSHGSDRGFSTPGLWSALRTSVESAAVATAVAALVGLPLARALARHHGRLATTVGVAVALPLALPPVMSGILLIYVIGPYTTLGRFFGGRLTGSVTGVVIAQVFVAAPFLVIAARSAFAAMDPSLDDRAAALGRRPLGRFVAVDLPVAGSAVRAGLLLTFLRAIGEYGANVVVAYHPYTLPVFTYVQFSGAGLPTTSAPTLLVLGAAAVAVAAASLRMPRRLARRGLDRSVGPVEPGPAPAVAVSFDLDLVRGSFHLRLAHQARSSRLAILGPSGSGKSMTLRALAGLYGPQAGPVSFGWERVEAVPTEARRLGYVPQGLGVFPHLTVGRQVLFGARADPPTARWWLDALGLAGLEDRWPDQLSGGQRQRLSLATVLATRPRLLLLDEPFSALDAPVRADLRRRLRRLQRQAGLSSVLVTHDPDEASLLADEVVVIAGGRLLQAGPVEEVLRSPAGPEVASVLGVENILVGVAGPGGRVCCGDLTVEAAAAGCPPGQPVGFCVRAEHVHVGDGPHRARVADVAVTGAGFLVELETLGGVTVWARTTAVAGEPGSSCRFGLDPARVVVWPTAAGGSPLGAPPPAPRR